MSQQRRSDECANSGYHRSDKDAFFVPNATHADNPLWNNCISTRPDKQNITTHFQPSHWDKRVSAQHFKPDARFINMFNRPTNLMPTNESELVNECKRRLVDGTTKDPMQHVRMICLSRGASGIYNLGRSLRRLADNGDKVSIKAFIKGLLDIEMGSVDEACRIFKAFETDFSGYIDMKEFLYQIRFLSDIREGTINKCFQTMDQNNDDVITIADIRRSYSVEHHPSFQSGEEDKEQILKRFLATFEEGDNPLAEITHEEFLNYYSGISVMIDDDEYFDCLLSEEYNLKK